MARHRWAALGAAALTLLAGGCGAGSSGSSTSSARIIDSLHARLVNEHVVQLHWTLASPAVLELSVAGVRRGSTEGQSAGDFPIPPSDVGAPKPASEGPGKAKIDFEFGEYNFRDYAHLRFRLRARTVTGVRDASRPIILSRSTDS